jgi:hypothetical protein
VKAELLMDALASFSHLQHFLAFLSMWAVKFLLSTFFRSSASYLWQRPSPRNVLHLAFDRVSAAWDNLCFWGYDELSTD